MCTFNSCIKSTHTSWHDCHQHWISEHSKENAIQYKISTPDMCQTCCYSLLTSIMLHQMSLYLIIFSFDFSRWFCVNCDWLWNCCQWVHLLTKSTTFIKFYSNTESKTYSFYNKPECHRWTKTTQMFVCKNRPTVSQNSLYIPKHTLCLKFILFHIFYDIKRALKVTSSSAIAERPHCRVG